MKSVSSAAPPNEHPRMISWSSMSDPNRRDLANQNESQNLKPRRGPQQPVALAGVQHHVPALGAEKPGDNEHDRREREHDVPGETSLGGLGFDALLEPQPLSDHIADV